VLDVPPLKDSLGDKNWSVFMKTDDPVLLVQGNRSVEFKTFEILK
jgi:hypothetical protein